MGTIQPSQQILSSGTPVVVRNAVPQDAAGIIEVMRDVFDEREYHLSILDDFTGTEAELRTSIQKFIDDPGKLMLVADAGGRIVAIMEFENDYRTRMKHRGTVWMSIASGMREQDLGTIIALHGWRWAENNPLIEKVYMHVLHTNTRSIGLCRKLGFVEEARLRNDVKLGPGLYADVVILSRYAREQQHVAGNGARAVEGRP
jgi:RimJ/RimL family protein N-acetyltransferase